MTDESPRVSAYTADSSTAPRLASAWMRYRFTRPRIILPFAIAFVLVIGVYVLNSLFATVKQSPVPTIVIFVIVFAVAGLMIRSSNLANFRRMFPAGATYTIAFGATELTISSPTARATTKYAAFRKVIIRDTAVLLASGTSRVITVLPRDLFTGNSAEVVQSRVAAAAAQPTR